MDPKKAENNNNSVQSSNILAFLISSPEITLAQELEFGLPTYTCTNSQGLCKIQRLYSLEEALIWPNEKRLVFLQFSILSISKTIKVVEDDMLGDTKGKGNCHFFITTAHPGSQIIEVEPSTFLSFSSVCVCVWRGNHRKQNTAVHNPGPAVEQICSYCMSEHQLPRDPCIELTLQCTWPFKPPFTVAIQSCRQYSVFKPSHRR